MSVDATAYGVTDGESRGTCLSLVTEVFSLDGFAPLWGQLCFSQFSPLLPSTREEGSPEHSILKEMKYLAELVMNVQHTYMEMYKSEAFCAHGTNMEGPHVPCSNDCPIRIVTLQI